MQLPRAPRSPAIPALPRALWVVLALAAFGGLPFLTARAARADECNDLLAQAETLIAQGERAKDPAPLRQALRLLDRAEQACPFEPQAPFMAGLTFVLLGDRGGAHAAGRRLLGLLRQLSLQQNRPASEADFDSRVLYLSGLVKLRLENDPVGAERQLALVRERTPAFMAQAVQSALYAAVLQVGGRQMRQGDFEAAAKSMRQAALLAGDDAARRDAAQRNLAQVYKAGNRYPEAERILLELAREYPRDVVVQFALASTYADQYKFGDAIRAWRTVIRLIDEKTDVDPRDLAQLTEVRLRYGVSLILSTQDPEVRQEGLRVLEAYVKAHPDDGRGWSQLGRLLHEEFEGHARAAECLEKALALDPWCERTLRLLVTIYTIHVPNPGRVARLTHCLETNSDRRKAEMELRKKIRTDATDGCW